MAHPAGTCPAALFIAGLAAGLLTAQGAYAQCLTGPDATGFESGPYTVSVLLPNSSSDTLLVGLNCVQGFGERDPGANANGTGNAEFISNSLGYRGSTGILVGGQGSGNGAASVGGSSRYVVRATSTPSYTGPAVVDVVVTLQADIYGNASVSGIGSAGGSYNVEVTLRPLDSQIGVVLFAGNGALATSTSVLLDNTAPIDVDRDYVLQIAVLQSVTASYSQGMMGEASSASSSGQVALSFETQLAVSDAELQIEYPMVEILLVPPPSLGNPPLFPPDIPAMGTASRALLGLSLLALALCLRAVRGR